MKIVTLSSKQQITLPQETLSLLAFGPGEKFLLEADQKRIILSPMRKSVVGRVAGSLLKYVSSEKRGIPFELLMKETKKVAAQKIAQEG
jgi:bifunctional DNA-binding transcriptional regulator/antitoxin component of YhaV-PrlF toxin-antitoxin module